MCGNASSVACARTAVHTGKWTRGNHARKINTDSVIVCFVRDFKSSVLKTRVDGEEGIKWEKKREKEREEKKKKEINNIKRELKEKMRWKNGPVVDVTNISSVVTGSPEPSSQSSSSSQEGRSWIFSLWCFGLNVVGDLVGATYTGVIMSSANREGGFIIEIA